MCSSFPETQLWWSRMAALIFGLHLRFVFLPSSRSVLARAPPSSLSICSPLPSPLFGERWRSVKPWWNISRHHYELALRRRTHPCGGGPAGGRARREAHASRQGLACRFDADAIDLRRLSARSLPHAAPEHGLGYLPRGGIDSRRVGRWKIKKRRLNRSLNHWRCLRAPGGPGGPRRIWCCSASLSELYCFLDVTNPNWSRVKG